MRPVRRAEPLEDAETSGFDIQSLLLPLWMFAFLSALLLARGVQPALRGAFVGSGRYIAPTDRAGDLATQATGILTSLLLIHLGLKAPRQFRSLVLGGLSLVLNLLVLLPLYLAHRLELPQVLTSALTLVTGLLPLLVSLGRQVDEDSRALLRIAGVVLALAGLGSFLALARLEQLSQAAYGLRLLVIVVLGAWFVREEVGRRRPIRTTSIAACATLLLLWGRNAGGSLAPFRAFSSRVVESLLSSSGSSAWLQWLWCWLFSIFVVDLMTTPTIPGWTRRVGLPLLALLSLEAPAPLSVGAFALISLTFLFQRGEGDIAL